MSSIRNNVKKILKEHNINVVKYGTYAGGVFFGKSINANVGFYLSYADSKRQGKFTLTHGVRVNEIENLIDDHEILLYSKKVRPIFKPTLVKQYNGPYKIDETVDMGKLVRVLDPAVKYALDLEKLDVMKLIGDAFEIGTFPVNYNDFDEHSFMRRRIVYYFLRDCSLDALFRKINFENFTTQKKKSQGEFIHWLYNR